MFLGEHKNNVLNSLKRCIENKLLSKEYLESKIALLPIIYEDVEQSEIYVLLDLLNPAIDV